MQESDHDYEKLYKIKAQALNNACSVLEENLGCPMQYVSVDCNFECIRDNFVPDKCWLDYFEKELVRDN